MNTLPYPQFLQRKLTRAPKVGFEPPAVLNPNMFLWQDAVGRYMIRVGNGLGALAVGLGKTIEQTTWAKCVHEHTGRKILIVCPLAVAPQTIREARKLTGIEVAYCRSQAEADKANTSYIITNQEMILKGYFDPIAWGGLVIAPLPGL